MSNEKSYPLPAPADLLLRTGLYQPFTCLNANDLSTLEFFGGPVDCYCINCKKESTFKNSDADRKHRLATMVEPAIVRGRIHVNKPTTGTMEVALSCTRCGFAYFFEFYIDVKYVNPENKEEPPLTFYTAQKVGQFPSYSDLNSHNAAKYRKILGNEKFREFTKSLNLASHDLGIASFVYLRRIFESLIEEARTEASTQEGWDDTTFEKLAMDKKITELKSFLPPFLTDHPKIYSVLSKGIHELSEEECLTYYEVIKTGIELILDQKLEKVERDKKTKEANAALQNIYKLEK